MHHLYEMKLLANGVSALFLLRQGVGLPFSALLLDFG
jgi:hypothetical protein